MQQFYKLIVAIVFGGVILLLGFGVGSSISARAQEAWTETPTEVLVIGETPSVTPVPSLDATQTPLPADTLTPLLDVDATSTPSSDGYYSVEALYSRTELSLVN